VAGLQTRSFASAFAFASPFAFRCTPRHQTIFTRCISPSFCLDSVAAGLYTGASRGLSCFGVGEIPYVYAALVFAAVLVVYYLVWKYLIGFFNRVVGIAASWKFLA